MALVGGFDFRATVAGATDPANCSPVVNSPSNQWQYPFVYGNGLTAGWTANPGDAFRDRNGSLDPRLVGINQIGNDGTQRTFRVDGLGAGKSYAISIALGDGGSGQQYQYLQAKDGSTVLFTLDEPGATVSQEWYDATGVLRTTAALWVANEKTKLITMAGTTLTLVVGTPTSQSGSSTIAHLFIQEVITGPVAATAGGASSNGQRTTGGGRRYKTTHHFDPRKGLWLPSR